MVREARGGVRGDGFGRLAGLGHNSITLVQQAVHKAKIQFLQLSGGMSSQCEITYNIVKSDACQNKRIKLGETWLS
jgi:hypothetical protein